ncbi:MAG: 3-oxosteroid 1-dehydrogenase [Dehalococcoidia bacterium DG_18]|nr:MAG: 3-oxosteroid 1-dehydrogenase [Dehalococcoidia bacterium DG_18]
MEFEHITNVVVVGSGAAGLTAAIAARDAGCEVIVLESMDKVGGSTAKSGGGIWIPNNPYMKACGVDDSYDAALTYMNEVIPEKGPASSKELREAYLKNAPELVRWLEGLGFKALYARGYPDYYPECSGGCAEGRCVESALFDPRLLGKQWKDKVYTIPVPMHTFEANKFTLVLRTWSGFRTTMDIIFRRAVLWRLLGKQRVSMGGALVGQLLKILLDRSVSVWIKTPLVSLITEGDAVVGVTVKKDGKEMRIRATHGVMLAAGGFEHNDAMRQQYQQHPITTEWTSGDAGNKGDGIQAGIAVGAAVEMMDEAWWMPTLLPKSGPLPTLFERSLPYSMIVDSSGKRFMNESQSYVACGKQQYARNKEVPAIPAYIILDSRHRKYYVLGTSMFPRITPKSAYKEGFITRADSLPELARKMGIDEAGLVATAKRFSEFARKGKDEDFHRGDSAYDRFYSDPRVKPNPNLGPIDTPPFYALKIWPGDLGTMGGLLIDEHARVLRKDGSVIRGLYAAGNNTASVMGRTYPGPGSTIGPAMVFGMIGGRHAATMAKGQTG